jgi:hypothetical protein
VRCQVEGVGGGNVSCFGGSDSRILQKVHPGVTRRRRDGSGTLGVLAPQLRPCRRCQLARPRRQRVLMWLGSWSSRGKAVDSLVSHAMGFEFAAFKAFGKAAF